MLLTRDFVSFIERSFYELNPQKKLSVTPYVELLAAKLEECRAGHVRRLIINLPPRSLKSHIASIAFVAWLLGHEPSVNVICASYGQDLADKLALDCRKLMDSALYQGLFNTRVASDKRAVADFMTTAKGGRMSTSVGGVLTGRGAEWLIIDDPLKPEDALSETKRTDANNWFDSTLRSRLNDKATGCIIVIMQRLHQDDLVGHLLSKEEWEVVSLPAIAEVDEVFSFESIVGMRTFSRRAGEALHPDREPLELLHLTHARIGDFNFACQYQQNPIPVGGLVVKHEWLTYYEQPPPEGDYPHVLQSWDTAVKSGELNDFSVCTTWMVWQGRYYLKDVFRKRLEYPELKRAVITLAERHRCRRLLIEDKASGSSLIQDLQGTTPCPVEAYQPPPGKDKWMRLFAQSDLFEMGKVMLPKAAPWLAEYRTELTSFPGSKYDDQVDSTTQALDHLRNNYGRNIEMWERLGR